MKKESKGAVTVKNWNGRKIGIVRADSKKHVIELYGKSIKPEFSFEYRNITEFHERYYSSLDIRQAIGDDELSLSAFKKKMQLFRGREPMPADETLADLCGAMLYVADYNSQSRRENIAKIMAIVCSGGLPALAKHVCSEKQRFVTANNMPMFNHYYNGALDAIMTLCAYSTHDAGIELDKQLKQKSGSYGFSYDNYTKLRNDVPYLIPAFAHDNDRGQVIKVHAIGGRIKIVEALVTGENAPDGGASYFYPGDSLDNCKEHAFMSLDNCLLYVMFGKYYEAAMSLYMDVHPLRGATII